MNLLLTEKKQMRPKPFMIQRGFCEEQDWKNGIDSILRFDYMGSSEFEFGALNKSLKRIRANVSDYMFRDVVVNDKLITVFCPRNMAEEIINVLEELAEGKYRLQEASYFDIYIYPEQHPMFSTLTADHWWDVENDFMFWKSDDDFTKHFKQKMGGITEDSEDYHKKFTLYWLDGKREVVEGLDVAKAMTDAGYENGAIKALDFHTDGEDTNYRWDRRTKVWKKERNKK